jgi:hypothetical protein
MTELARRNGHSHGPDCPCQRCRGFERGNLASLKHGARSVLTLAKRTGEIRERLLDVGSVVADADGAAFDLCATTLAQVEVASQLIERVRREQLAAVAAGEQLTADDLVAHARLAQDCRGWINSCTRLLRELGMTTLSRAQLGLDIASTRRTLSLIELHQQAAEERAEAGTVDGEAEEVSA